MCHSLSPSARWSCHSMASSGTTFPDNCAYTDFRATRWRRVHDLPATRWQRVARAGDNAIVYTNWLEWPLGAILGHLCTLLGCCAVVDRREDAIVYTNRRKWPISAVLGHLCTLLRCCGQTWGRRSVHKWEDRASRRRIGAFVYTVATRVAIRIATRAASGGMSASTATACWRRPLAGPSRLVGKTGSERAAPLPGWHLRRGVNPHEPLKSTKNGPTHYGVGPRTSLVDRQGFEPWTLGLRVPCSTS